MQRVIKSSRLKTSISIVCLVLAMLCLFWGIINAVVLVLAHFADVRILSAAMALLGFIPAGLLYWASRKLRL
jgi:predicted RND superfamily exporter protein